LANHSDTSWKHDHPSTLLSNSVQKVNDAVKQAVSHPGEQLIDQANNAISHAENALVHAEQQHEHMDIVQQNKDHLEQLKQQLLEAQDTLENR